jgi:hypothetical protein
MYFRGAKSNKLHKYGFLVAKSLHVNIFKMSFSNVFVKLSEKLEFIMMKLILNGLSEIKVMTNAKSIKIIIYCP